MLSEMADKTGMAAEAEDQRADDEAYCAGNREEAPGEPTRQAQRDLHGPGQLIATAQADRSVSTAETTSSARRLVARPCAARTVNVIVALT
jgi:hypothetical protein